MTLGQKLLDSGLFIATAESLTAGQISAELANTPGASKFLLGGVVSYQNEVKIQQLGVSSDQISMFGPVDQSIAKQMASGARARFASDCAKPIDLVIGLSSTGVAGPDPLGEKPVGLVYIGVSSSRGERAVELRFLGSRAEIRAATVTAALSALEDEIQALLG